MKFQFTDFLRKCQFPLLLITGSLPVLLILLWILSPKTLPFVWLVVGVYLVGALFMLIISGTGRLIAGLASIAATLAAGLFVSFYLRDFWTMVPAAVCCGFLAFGLYFAGWSWDEEMPGYILATGVGIHVTAQFLRFFSIAYEFNMPDSVATGLTVSLFAFAFFAMLSANRATQIRTALARQKPSATVRRKNAAFVIVFFGIALVIAITPAVIQAFRDFLIWVLDTINSLLFTTEELPETTLPPDPTETEGESIFDQIEAKPLPPWLDWLQARLYVFFKAAALPLTIVAFVLLVFILARPVARLLRRLLEFLRNPGEANFEDYEDEITSTNENKENSASVENKRKKVPFWERRKLPPREQIRLHYQMLQKKHPQWQRSSTARENLPENVAPYYELARYSDKEITEEDARQFTSGTKKI